jgi:aspartokinase-like uncharacterized kinase
MKAVDKFSNPISDQKEPKTFKGKSMKLGGGGRFAKLQSKLQSKGKSASSAKKIAASVGMKKYGAKKMSKMASIGKKRAK